MKKVILLVILGCLALGVWLAIHSTRDSRLVSPAPAGNQPSTNGSATGVAPSNSALGAAGLTQSATPARPATPLETWTDKQMFRLGVQEIIAKDIAEGINAEVREKEAKLRGLASNLRAGLTLEEVLRTLGKPDAVNTVLVETNANGKESWSISDANSVEGVPPGMHMCLSYWPRVGVPFDGRNGQGYEVLFVLLNGERRLERWAWQQPEFFLVGTMNMRSQQEQYWFGKHATSGPPAFGYSLSPF